MSFRDELQAVKKSVEKRENIEDIARELVKGIKNHVLSLASNVHQGSAFSCKFDICLGTAKIGFLSVEDVSGYLSKKEISKTDWRIAELYRKYETEISLYSEAFELHSIVQRKLKIDGIKVSDIFIGELGSNADISDGDYRIGWKQDGVVFDIEKISQKVSPAYDNSIYSPNTVVPCGDIAKRYSYNSQMPLICLHKYRKGFFDYSAQAYLVQNATSEMMASTDHHRRESTTIAYCFKVEYADK